MRIKKVELKEFKRFHHLTIDLGDTPKKIVALIGPNGCGKSSTFDAFEEKNKEYRSESFPVDMEYFDRTKFSDAGSKDSYKRNERVIMKFSDEPKNKRNIFCIRSAYRFTPSLNSKSIKSLRKIEEDVYKPPILAEKDNRLEENYERLIGNFFNDVYGENLTGQDWNKKNIDALNQVLNNVLDISISSLGNPVNKEGKLYFNKGNSKNFPYDFLSAGEKEVLNLIIDLFLKKETFDNTIFCIDEPELHINTSVQRKLLVELEKLIGDHNQLWVATHSIGFIRALQNDLKDKSQIIDMSEHNFDKKVDLSPITMTRKEWLRIFKTAIDDLTGLLAPKHIVFCEGKLVNSLDEEIFNSIFGHKDDVQFVSSTSREESIKFAGLALTVLNKAFDKVDISVVVDRDDKEKVIAPGADKSKVRIKTLERREFENYLFDFEIISKAYPNVRKEDFNNIVSNPIEDDVKSKINEVLGLTRESNTKKLKRNLAANITADTQVYKELDGVIFGG